MTSPVRQEILRLLGQLGDMAPEVRFGQLIANFSYMAVAPTAEAIWDMEDEQLLRAVKELIGKLSERESNVA